MIKFILVFTATMLLGFYTGIKHIFNDDKFVPQSAEQIRRYKLLNAISCSPDFELAINNNQSIPLLKGWGKHRMNISTKDDSAFLYFNQGINMFYGFHFIEARASFKKAQDFDSSCALAYLGEALTYGPNINNPAYKLRPYVLTLINKAKQHASGCNDVEKALIEAQVKRYDADTSKGLQKVNDAYANTMKGVYDKLSANSDVAALYADALMQLHPWDLYDNVGNPKSWTAFIEGEITKLIKRFPDHPGLNHYYIHCVEASNTAYRGLQSARKLPLLTPGLSHMLHMSSHIYIRAGYYSDGVAANEQALNAYEQYKNIYPDVERYVSLYYGHNLSMEFANALFLPNYGTAKKIAYLKRISINANNGLNDTLSNAEQYSYCLPELTWLRFGKWDSILAEPRIPQHLIYSNLLQHFAKGIALAKKRKPLDALKEVDAIEEIINHPDLQLHGPSENAPAVSGTVALLILKGVIALAQNDNEKAINYLQKAVSKEDAMVYNEPKDWLLPARHYLGVALISANQFLKAEKVFKEDLKLNPKNVWGLAGLYQALFKQHKTIESQKIYQQLKSLMSQTDVKIETASF
jgi:tetratricopeptide (TPR) repeat protein